MTRSHSAFVSPTRHPGRTLAAALGLAIVAAAPLALAQTTKHTKTSDDPPAPPSGDATAETDTGAPPPAAPNASSQATAHPANSPESPPPLTADNTMTTENPNQRYVFVGLRYRGTIIPQFLENLFVSEGATIYSNSFGAEIDIRKGGQSMIPWIQYTDYSTGDILFLQKGQPNIPANYSVVNSNLKAVYVGLDELWSVPLTNHFDFEFGFGVGIGAIFGDLRNDWVYQSTNGPYTASNGTQYSVCPGTGNSFPNQVPGQVSGCVPSNHTSPNPAKVGGYIEPNWFNGGSVPVIFPHISIPQLSLRYKPVKQFEARLSAGFSLTGFWFGLSADYGLEKPDDASTHKASSPARERDTL